MISLTSSPLSADQAAEIISWLSAPQATVLVQCLSSRLAALEAKIAKGYVDSKSGELPNMIADAVEGFEEYMKIRHCLDVLADVKNKAGDLSLTQLSVSNEFTSKFLVAKPTTARK